VTAKRLFLKAAGVTAAGALLKACGGGGGGGGSSGPTGSLTLLQVLQQDGRFSTLLTALQDAGLADRLGQTGTRQTLFAPTNDAFNTLAQRIGGLSAQERAALSGFHVVPQFLSAADLRSLAARGETPNTLYNHLGNPAVLIFVVDNNGPLSIWDGIGRTSITIPETDVPASNGVLHVVSDVLLPRYVLTVSQMLRANTDSLFAASMSAQVIAELDGAGPYTVFAPSNDAITGAVNVRDHVLAVQIGGDDFPPAATAYSTLSGRTTRLTKGAGPPVLGTLTDSTPVQAIVTDVDFFGSNGVIHVINKVLTP
jgi:transforming growth factor-beta-induced protein